MIRFTTSSFHHHRFRSAATQAVPATIRETEQNSGGGGYLATDLHQTYSSHGNRPRYLGAQDLAFYSRWDRKNLAFLTSF